MDATLTNTRRKLYASLSAAKGRRESGLFMAQGTKCVLDTMQHFQTECLLATARWAQEHPDLLVEIVKRCDLERITTLSDCPEVIAVYRIPQIAMDWTAPQRSLALALDCVQDPGNVGTIMRVADWMGVDTIYASQGTADVWSPKVVQATMGAIARVKVLYADLAEVAQRNAGCPVYGTFLDGESIYKTTLSSTGLIIMGNEGKGISPALAKCVSHRLLIPSYPPAAQTSESLNVAIATAITLSEFRRNG